VTLYHLYTIAGLVLALALVYRLFQCAHAWELVDKTEFPSIIEESKKLGVTLNNITGMDTIISVYQKKVLIVMRCDRCGAAQVTELKS